jgi:hypothetical protein
MSLIVDQYGEPIEMAPEPDEAEFGIGCCPKCGEVGESSVITGFGGWWRLLCSCGHEFKRGRGVAPVAV